MAGNKVDTELFAAAGKRGRDRLYPSLFSANYLELTSRRIFMERFFASIGRVETILDVGAQYSPYYDIFKSKCDRYLSMDIIETPLVDIVCNAEAMLLDDSAVDIVICTQVLEHCDYPQKIIDECYRVLKPGGVLIITVPSVFPEHGYPADRWRFMPQGLEFMLDKFLTVEVKSEMDFPSSWISTNIYFVHTLTGRFRLFRQFCNPVIHFAGNNIAKLLSFALRPVSKKNFRSFSANLWAVARK